MSNNAIKALTHIRQFKQQVKRYVIIVVIEVIGTFLLHSENILILILV